MAFQQAWSLVVRSGPPTLPASPGWFCLAAPRPCSPSQAPSTLSQVRPPCTQHCREERGCALSIYLSVRSACPLDSCCLYTVHRRTQTARTNTHIEHIHGARTRNTHACSLSGLINQPDTSGFMKLSLCWALLTWHLQLRHSSDNWSRFNSLGYVCMNNNAEGRLFQYAFFPVIKANNIPQ